MKIYFAASIRGGRSLLTTYQAIVAYLKQSRHEVLSEHIAAETMADQGRPDDEIYRQDAAWLEECDAVVAEVTVPSLGVGYEIGYALHQAHKPVLCLCQTGVDLSAMLTGNSHSGLEVRFYDDLEAAQRHIVSFLAHVQTEDRE